MDFLTVSREGKWKACLRRKRQSKNWNLKVLSSLLYSPENLPSFSLSSLLFYFSIPKPLITDTLTSDTRAEESLTHMGAGLETETISRTANFGSDVILSIASLLIPGGSVLLVVGTTDEEQRGKWKRSASIIWKNEWVDWKNYVYVCRRKKE